MMNENAIYDIFVNHLYCSKQVLVLQYRDNEIKNMNKVLYFIVVSLSYFFNKFRDSYCNL